MSILGQGILKGLGVTLRHFINSYAEEFKYLGNKAGLQPRPLRRQSPKNRGVVTIEYPKERAELPEHFRNIPFLVNDTEADEIKCTSCGICAKVCPPQCIWIVRTEDPVTKRPVPQPQNFFIDTTICMNCGYCAEFCPFDAIKMNKEYELGYFPGQTTAERMVYDKQALLLPDTYHAQIHPSDWEREQETRRAEEAKKAEEAAKKAAKAAAPAAGAPAAAPAPKPAGPPAAAKPPAGGPAAGGPPPAAKPPAGGPPPAAKPPAGGPPPAAKPPAGGPPPAAKPPPAGGPAAGGPPPAAKPPAGGPPPATRPPAGGPPPAKLPPQPPKDQA